MKEIVLVAGILFLLGSVEPASAQSLFERCEKQKADTTAMKSQIGDIEGQLVTFDQQLGEFAQRLRDLESQKAAKLREKGALLQQIRSLEREQERMCSPLRQCVAYETRVDELKRRATPQAEIMRRFQDEIRERNTETGRLDREADKIENSYRQLNCDNLVPGQTAQSTIDRCSDLFSEWNRLQTDINRLQESIASLRTRYQQAMNQLQAIGTEIARLLAQMRDACGHSPRLAELEGIDRDHRQYGSIRGDLDAMDNRVKHYRAIRIQKPKLSPMKGLKPKLEKREEKREGKHKPTLTPIH